MSLGFVSFAARSFRGLAVPGAARVTLLTGRAPVATPAVVWTTQRPRMQCTPTGEVPEYTSTVMSNMERKITESLEPERLHIAPRLGDPNGAHIEIEVVSQKFEGMNAVKRHQAVYKAIWEELSVSHLATTKTALGDDKLEVRTLRV